MSPPATTVVGLGTSSLVKLPFLFPGLAAGYVLMTSPQPKIPVEKHSRDVRPYERFFSAALSSVSKIAKTLLCGPLILEIAVIIASHCSSSCISQTLLGNFVHGSLTLTEWIALSRPFLLGWGLGLLGASLRYQCYRALDRSFTFELATRNDQRLITDGLYGYVRHPSYTTGIMGGVGISLVHIAQGSWLRECGILQTRAGKALWTLHVGVLAFIYLGVLWRTSGEDEMLKKHFGKDWEAYAKRVPYRLIPYVY
ncbi:hypothetical protein DAEQUDRAFT_732751 [Daedalea quercina L-15889]|uniref:Protein-S-isoprenylcysteine O-methyltransferase n=1 Tax=Daedalea quercina L-15889 TaxID=1314783 RepID=A0A165LFW8_9APHY|nr:hypothetical protein DAEQUDRAFT_732751 [Daedalea quercina L-15889]